MDPPILLVNLNIQEVFLKINNQLLSKVFKKKKKKSYDAT